MSVSDVRRIDNPQRGDALPFAAYQDTLVLEANTAVVWTVPVGCNLINLSYSGTCLVFNGDDDELAVPVASITDGTGVEIMPARRRVKAGQKLSFVAGAACLVGIGCHRV